MTRYVFSVKLKFNLFSRQLTDNLGWWPDFTEKGIKNIEDILESKGETVKRVPNSNELKDISEQLELIPNK